MNFKIGAPAHLTPGRHPGLIRSSFGQVAQSVEQGTENPRVGSSILSLATIISITYSDFGSAEKTLCANFAGSRLTLSRHNTTNLDLPFPRLHTVFAALMSRDNSATE